MLWGFSKGGALVVMLVACGLFARPGCQAMTPWRAHDSFPVSTFEMFSKPRPHEHAITYVVGHRKDADPKPLGSWTYAKGGMNQILAQLNKMRVRGNKSRLRWCRDAAARVAKRKSLKDVESIAVMREYYVPDKLFRLGEREPERSKVVVRCRVKR